MYLYHLFKVSVYRSNIFRFPSQLRHPIHHVGLLKGCASVLSTHSSRLMSDSSLKTR